MRNKRYDKRCKNCLMTESWYRRQVKDYLRYARCNEAYDRIHIFEIYEVVMKKTYESGSIYICDPKVGMYGAGHGDVKFKAPETFAKVGDIIIFEDGVLKVK